MTRTKTDLWKVEQLRVEEERRKAKAGSTLHQWSPNRPVELELP